MKSIPAGCLKLSVITFVNYLPCRALSLSFVPLLFNKLRGLKAAGHTQTHTNTQLFRPSSHSFCLHSDRENDDTPKVQEQPYTSSAKNNRPHLQTLTQPLLWPYMVKEKKIRGNQQWLLLNKLQRRAACHSPSTWADRLFSEPETAWVYCLKVHVSVSKIPL